MQDIKNKVILITGGSKGIGYGIAEALLTKGCKVAITSRRQEAADQAAIQLDPSSENILALQADVRSYEDQKAGVDKIIAKWGKLDGVIANAGLGHFASIEDITIEQWNEVIDTNLTGPFNSIKASVAALKESKGYYITISSLAGTNFFANGAAYNASKFGLTGFTQAVMLDLRNAGIKVSTIMPGSVATHFNDHQPNDADAWKIQKEDLGELVVDILEMNPRTLPSKIEVRPSQPPIK